MWRLLSGRMMTLAEAENMGAQFAKAIGKPYARGIARHARPGSAGGFHWDSPPAAIGSHAPLTLRPAASLRKRSAIVDGWFLPQDIYTAYAQGKQNDIPLITGGTNDEGPEGESLGAAAQRPRTPSPPTRHGSSRSSAPGRTLSSELYPAKTDAEAARAYHDVRRDIIFAGHRTWAKLQAATGKSPVYLYKFSHIPPHPEPNGINPLAPVGAVHSSDVRYVFNTLRMKDYPWTDIDRKVADMLASYWTNFAKNADPNGPGLPFWPVYNPKDEYLMNFGDTFRLERFNSAGVDLDRRRAGRPSAGWKRTPNALSWGQSVPPLVAAQIPVAASRRRQHSRHYICTAIHARSTTSRSRGCFSRPAIITSVKVILIALPSAFRPG